MSAQDAALAAALLAVDPEGLGGATLQGDAAAWLALLRGLLPGDAPWRRLPVSADDIALSGGLDLALTLAAGRPVTRAGLLAEAKGGVVVAPGAERMSAARAGRLALAHDAAPFALALLDEGAGPEERPPSALLDRVAFSLDLAGVRTLEIEATAAAIAAARARLPTIAASEAAIEAICVAGLALGVGSLRAERFALRAACAHAALRGAEAVEDEDLACAARLVLAPRATRLPAPPVDAPEEPEDPQTESPEAGPDDTPSDPPEARADPKPPHDMLVAAARAALPQELLAGLARSGARPHAGGRGGAPVRGVGRGRPAGVKPGLPKGGERLALVDTLRAAAPWRRLRTPPKGCVLAIRREDLRVRRVVRPVEHAIIFVVDASGSAAAQRLAEAKGAVELLLAQAYVRRTQVALVAFRGAGAQALLPPTRSLARARRLLADLAGGGATPLAAGIEAGRALCEAARARGRAPQMILLTDGRGNVALDGAVDRSAAEADALAAGRRLRLAGIPAALVDVSPRPRAEGRALAEAMGARYAFLPRLGAATLKDLADA